MQDKVKGLVASLSEHETSLKSALEELEALKALMDGMVPRSEMLAAKADAKNAKEESEAKAKQVILLSDYTLV